MQKLSFQINRLANAQVRLCSWAMVVLGAVMTLVILIQVFFRYVIYLPVPWTAELAKYLMVWMGMLGAVAALRQGRHIGVRVLVERLPSGTYDYVVPLVQAAEIGFLILLAWQGWEFMTFNLGQNSPAMEIPMLVPYAAIPVGCVMMALNVVADILQDRWPTDQGSDANIAAGTLAPGANAGACRMEEE
jgi:TRAP-type C4-dicarboxylate transport system permease small subunit